MRGYGAERACYWLADSVFAHAMKPWTRRSIAVSIGAASALLAVEIGARVILASRGSAVAALRGRLYAEAGDTGSDRAGGGGASIVLHPYLGYTHDPGGTINRFGFQGRPPVTVGEPGTVFVGVFGGSFAANLAQDDRELRTAFEQIPAFAGKQVELICCAVGGYRQPQPALALAYLLSIGARFDVVIEVDGFNEVALPWAENEVDGHSPFFPRRWSSLAAGTPTPARLLAAGRVALARDSIAKLDAAFRQPVLDRSAAWLVIWSGLRNRREAAVAVAEREYQQPATGDVPAFARGPQTFHADAWQLVVDSVALWERSSRHMHALCQDAGVPYFHFLQPNQYDAGSKVLSALEGSTAFLSTSPYREAVLAGYPLLRSAGVRLRSAGVFFEDLTDTFAEVTETLYRDTCCHVNAAGNRMVAGRIAVAVAAGWSAAVPCVPIPTPGFALRARPPDADTCLCTATRDLAVRDGDRRLPVHPDRGAGSFRVVTGDGEQAVVRGWAELESGVAAERVAVFAGDRLVGIAHPFRLREGIGATATATRADFCGFELRSARWVLDRGGELRAFGLGSDAAFELRRTDDGDGAPRADDDVALRLVVGDPAELHDRFAVGVAVARGDEGWSLDVTGDRPRLRIPVAATSSGQFELRLSMTSCDTEERSVVVYHSDLYDDLIEPQRRLSLRALPGRHDYRLILPTAALGTLRIDLDPHPSRYLLHSLEIVRIPD